MKPFGSALRSFDGRIFLILVAFALQAVVAQRLEPWTRPPDMLISSLSTPPRFASTLRAVADLTGMRVLIGHAFWMRVIQYYGDSLNARERYIHLFPYCSIAADLNPYYIPNYLFGAAPLAFHLHRADEAVQLLQRGIEANPKANRLKLLMAAIAYQNKSEWEKVIPLLEAQVEAGDAPSMLANILANIYRKAGRYNDAIALWRQIQKNASTDEDRIMAGQKLQELYQLTRQKPGGIRSNPEYGARLNSLKKEPF